jgi:hypothetical protein
LSSPVAKHTAQHEELLRLNHLVDRLVVPIDFTMARL